MKLLRLMKVRIRLAVLISIMSIGLILIGVFGFIIIGTSNNMLKSIYTQNVNSIEFLSDARTQSRANYGNILDLVLTQDSGDIKTILADYDTRSDAIEEDFAKFKKTELDQYETKQFKQIQDDMSTWTQSADQMKKYIAAGDTIGAIRELKGSGKRSFDNLQTNIRALVNYNIKEARTVYDDSKKSGERAKMLIIVMVVLADALCTTLALLISHSISKPVKRIVGIIKETSQLNFVSDKSDNDLMQYKDEFGNIAIALNVLKEELRKISGHILSISSNLTASSEELAATTDENTKTINQVVVAVNEIAQGNSSQAEMVEKTSETVASLVESVDRVNKETAKTSTNAEISMNMVEEGQKAVDVTIEKMKLNKKVTGNVGEAIDDLSHQMDKVGSIISVISEISNQTNLLSLNASIEAARAGEAGKGFAIVATEIGKLASQTASAVNEITEIVVAAIEKNKKTSENNQIAKDIVIEQENAINIMKDSFDRIKTSVEDITKRTRKIADQTDKINSSTKLISDQTHDISAAAEQAAASSQEISASNEEQLASIEMIASAANDLSKMATELNAEISKFRI